MPLTKQATNAARILRQAADAQKGLQLTDDMKDALNALATLRNKGLESADVSRLASEVMTKTCSPTGAGFIAVWLGGNVEKGVDASLSVADVIKIFITLTGKIETPAEQEDDETEEVPMKEFEPDEATIDGLQLVGTSLVAHLARLPANERAALDLTRLSSEAERLSPYSFGAMWVETLLRQESGKLIVLDVAKQKGWQACYYNLTNCFHLFTLLQGALLSAKPESANHNPTAIVSAKGETFECHDQAWWHYGQPYAAEADLGASVWGEASPVSVGGIDDNQVLLLWPPLLGNRSWDAGFFSPFLAASPPSVTIERALSADELQHWWSRLGLPRQSSDAKPAHFFGNRPH